jgi:hypothetical protein
MNDRSFDVLPRFLIQDPTRRNVLHSLAGSVFAAIIGVPFGGSHADARKRRGGKRRRHKRHTKGGYSRGDPVTRADAGCNPPTWSSLAGDRCFAQTFRARRSGQLTRAAIGLTFNGEGAAFELAIRELDPQGKPGYVLASTTISDVPGTNLNTPPIDNGPTRTITGTFATPATVIAGQGYAVALTQTEPGTGWEDGAAPFAMQASQDDPCSDGMAFGDRDADGGFSHSYANWDFAISTEVTA